MIDIKKRRIELDLTQDDVGKAVGVGKATVSKWEKGIIDEMGRSKISALAKVLKISPLCLLDDISEEHHNHQIGTPYTPSHRIPILGRISAGLPLYAEQNIEGYTYTDLNDSGEYFALIVKGDSMNALRMCDGDIAIIRKQETVEDGDIAVVMIGTDEATIKRFYQNDNMVTLMPQSTNPNHQPQIYDASIVNIKIIGKLKEVKIAY